MTRIRGAIVLAVAHLLIARAVLALGHPHEDAYILFKYAANVAAGRGIVYFPGGPHAEGATDFLWMIALAGARVLGADPAMTAAVLSAIAFGVCVYLVSEGLTWPKHAALIVLLPLLLCLPSAIAAYMGFSAMVFATACLAILVLYRRGSPSIVWLPILGLGVGLLRPDGVILAGAFVVLALPVARRAGVLPRYLSMASIAAGLGLLYFVWRWRYFGHLLPLPLYVKSRYEGYSPGVDATLDWALSTLLPLGGVLVLGRLLLGRSPATRTLVLGLVPFALHALSFMPGAPSQNIGNRFQSPFALALVYAAFQLAREAAQTESKKRAAAYAAALALAFVPQGQIAQDTLGGAFELQYLNRFAHDLGHIAPPETRIATTEAGRLAYWSHGPVLDVVGLNTPETARAYASADTLARFDPDVVMFTHVGLIDEKLIDGGNVIPLRAPLSAFVPAVLHPFLKPVSSHAPFGWDATRGGAMAAIAFLDERPDAYDVYAVRFKARFGRFHIYGIRRSFPAREELLHALDVAHHPGEARSYLELAYLR